jgi:hypothetical protein
VKLRHHAHCCGNLPPVTSVARKTECVVEITPRSFGLAEREVRTPDRLQDDCDAVIGADLLRDLQALQQMTESVVRSAHRQRELAGVGKRAASRDVP